MPVREEKPAWSQVPASVRAEAERRLGSRVTRATRAYGGYAASATFRLVLANGKRAFFKAGYPLPAGSPVVLPIAQETRRYAALAPLVGRWMPKQLGAFHRQRWDVLLMEDLGPATIPPWSADKARRASRSYARFHARTLGRPLPRGLSRTRHQRFGTFWGSVGKTWELSRAATVAGRRADEAEEWLAVALPTLRKAERDLVRAKPPFVALHFDTRSDNFRLVGERLVMFDWPWACAGPAEFDVAAFAQAVAAERGPDPERVVSWYEQVLPLRERELSGSIAGIAGYFTFAAWRPPLEGLPRLRSVQRKQLRASVAWAARHFGLPEPGWLSAVPD
jgi:hypothetical protein